MTPSAAAKIIGCSTQQVRTLIRKGTMNGIKVPYGLNNVKYMWDVTQKEAERIRDRKLSGTGWPRGKKKV